MQAFECKMCGECCYGEGGITVQEEEIEKTAKFLGIRPETFVIQYCDEKGGRFFIKTGADKYCIFYDKEKRCQIHPVKPSICSSWPFYPALLRDADNWESAKDACPGINPNCSFEEFVKQSQK